MTAKSTRLRASQATFAPRSSISDSPRNVGKNPAIAGLSTPGRVFNTNLAMANSAPVLPAETTPAAWPSRTVLIARRMLELRLRRNATEALSSAPTTSSV